MEESKLEEIVYDEITLNGDEIEQLKTVEPVIVSEKQRAAYHNKIVKQIQGSIRKSVKNKKKDLMITCFDMFGVMIHPVHWQKEITKEIVQKLKGNNVKITYNDNYDSVKVIF
mgnify:CR=1 FL=1